MGVKIRNTPDNPFPKSIYTMGPPLLGADVITNIPEDLHFSPGAFAKPIRSMADKLFDAPEPEPYDPPKVKKPDASDFQIMDLNIDPNMIPPELIISTQTEPIYATQVSQSPDLGLGIEISFAE